MAGLVEEAMKQNLKRVKPMTAGAFERDPMNNTAVPVMEDGPDMAYSVAQQNQNEGNPEMPPINPGPTPAPGTPTAPPPDDGGQGPGGGNTEPGGGGVPGTGTNPLNRPPGTGPDSDGSGVIVDPPATPPANPGNPAAPVGTDPNGTGWFPGGVVPPGGGGGGSPATPPPVTTATPTWNPQTGLVESVTQGGVQNTEARGYVGATVGNAQGYSAEGYDPTLSGENLSSAVDRIIGKGGALMQRADAAGRAQANRRGILNSTMGVQASQNAVLDKATEIGAGDVQNAQFNAGQKNEAAAFSANARNRAAEFGAGEANDMMMFAAEQYNIAERFAAEAENAANSQNAQAHTAAMQRYNDALNAARAAEQDAENMARRDRAQFEQQTREGNADRQNRISTANIGANASVQTANINAASRSADAAADREFRANENATDRRIRREEFDVNTQTRVDGMGQDAFNRYTSGRNDILTRDMEPEQRNAALQAWDTTWAGNPYLPVDIDLSAYDDPTDAGTETEED